MIALLSLILTLYCLFLVVYLVGWVRIRRQTMPARSDNPISVSIVVAVRNEANSIQNLLQNLSAMAFPRDKFEIIVVNDHSTDDTVDLARKSIASISNAQLLDLGDGQEGKKAALHLGISQARFEVVATTDADCILSKNWLTCLASYFEVPETKFLIGAVKYQEGGDFFDELQMMEFVSLTGATAAAVGLGHPVMCNGANLAFRKSVFDEVGGYEDNLDVASGDDEFVMRKVIRRYPKGVKFINYYEAVVITSPLKTMRELIQQRIRWAGKWRHNSDPLTRLLAVFIFASQLSFLTLFVINLSRPEFVASGLLISKLFLEGVFIFWVSRYLDIAFNILSFVVLQITYPLYVTYVGVLSLFSSYQWKNRIYK